MRYLRDASKLGSPLIVRIAPDAAIAIKGRRPIQTQDERAQTVFALGVVDKVVLHATLADAVTDLKPKYLVKGRDWQYLLPEDVRAACQAVGTEIVYTDTQERTSTERLTDCDPGDENDRR